MDSVTSDCLLFEASWHAPRVPQPAPCHALQGQPTVPSLLGEEKATNPFLRPFSEAIRTQLGSPAGAPDWQVFGAVRRAKDTF